MQSQLITNKNIKVCIKNLEAQIGQLSKKIAAHANSRRGFNNNIIDNPGNENYSVVGLRSRVVEAPIRVSDEKKKSEEKLVSEDDRKKGRKNGEKG